MEELIEKNGNVPHELRPISDPDLPKDAYFFETFTGKLFIDHSKCVSCESHGCVESCTPEILKLVDGRPILAVTEGEARKGKCTECLACEIFCKFHEKDAIFVHLPIPGLDKYRKRKIEGNPDPESTEKERV